MVFHRTSQEQEALCVLFRFSLPDWFFSATTGNLPFSSSLLHSICLCVSLHRLRVSSSPCLSLYFVLSPWGHWGRAWCRGLVDKYHVKLFHVFSGRVEVSSVTGIAPQSGSAFCSAQSVFIFLRCWRARCAPEFRRAAAVNVAIGFRSEWMTSKV